MHFSEIIKLQLRTVPTIVTAHTFCASRDTRVSYGWCLLIQEYFCAVLNYTEKAEPSKCFWYPKRKLGVTMHFSEIIKLQLRTVPTIVTAHTLCASQDTRVSYGWCLLIQEYFCAVLNYTEKAELSKCFWYPKRKLGVTMHISEIIKLQFKKKSHTLLYILALFRDVIAQLSLKNTWLPPIFFLDSNSPC